jgi:hypothetical protein
VRNDPERHTILHVACCTLHVSPSVQRCMRCAEPCCNQAIQWCLCLKVSPQRCTVQVRLCFVHHKTAADPVASEVRRRCASHRIASLLYVRFFDSVCLSRQASATDLAVWLSRLTPIAER